MRNDLLVIGPRSAFQKHHSREWSEVLADARGGLDGLGVGVEGVQVTLSAPSGVFWLHEVVFGDGVHRGGLLSQGW